MNYSIKRPKIVIIGAGNVAFNFAISLHAAKFEIAQVYSRTAYSAENLARNFNTMAITSIHEIDQSADIFLFAVTDDVLPEIINNINFSGQLAIHTSGSVPMDVFNNKAEHFGVIYPLQTLSKSRKINMKEVPLLIEANSAKNLANLKSLAETISLNVIISDSLQRRQIHLAAIFASNFTNHMYVIADELIKKSGLSYKLLKPIIIETALKAIELDNPSSAQTGPAKRMDRSIIEKHLEMLSDNKELQTIYSLISKHIEAKHHK